MLGSKAVLLEEEPLQGLGLLVGRVGQQVGAARQVAEDRV